MDIRNSVSALRRLDDCTVVEGQLHIVLTDRGRELDFANLSFPRLREITDYLLLYRVSGLRSLSTLFPNLSVIRGQFLLYNYALVIYEMPDMYDVGLVNLVQISRGSVRSVTSLQSHFAMTLYDAHNIVTDRRDIIPQYIFGSPGGTPGTMANKMPDTVSGIDLRTCVFFSQICSAVLENASLETDTYT